MAKITNVSSLTSKYTVLDQGEKDYSTTSNRAVTENMTTSFLKDKTTEKDVALPNDEILQTLTLTNNSDSQITNIQIKDIISAGGSFKTGSLKIDNQEYPNFNPVEGYTLPNPLNSKDSTTITYTLVIDAKPTSDVVNNVSSLTYDVGEQKGLQENSNVAIISIEQPTITIEKTADKMAVVTGQTITFTNTITNTGTVKHSKVTFTDDIPTGTTFVTDSVKVDGTTKTGENPSKGIDLGELSMGAKTVVTFEVTVEK